MTDLLTIPPEIDRPPVPATPMAIIADMVRRGAEPDQLAKLMDLQERYERNRAADAFAKALAKFQANCPPVHKGRRADRYDFAGFDDIMRTIRPVLAGCKLSVTFDTKHAESIIDIAVVLTCGIHSERRQFSCPVPKELKVNESQKYGAALSYAKRYAICAALNIVVTDEDTDAAGLDTTPITPEQAIQVNDCIKAKKVDRVAFLRWVTVLAKTEVADVDQIPAAVFPKVWDMLKRKKG